jgi:hypothetical protein
MPLDPMIDTRGTGHAHTVYVYCSMYVILHMYVMPGGEGLAYRYVSFRREEYL